MNIYMQVATTKKHMQDRMFNLTIGKKKKALMFQIITKFQFSQISPKGPPYDSYLNPTPPHLVIHISMINKQLY